MKLIRANRPRILTTLAAALVAGSVACGSPSGGENVANGSIASAVSAVGPDGATYSLPAGTTLSLVAASGGATYVFPVDTGGTSASYSVPAGRYAATLSTVTELLRAGDAGPLTPVNATLSDAQPYEITVVAGLTTDLTLHFSAAGGEAITFSSGTVNTTVSVSFDAGPANAVGSTLQLNLTAQTNGTSTGPLTAALTFEITGPFVQNVGDVCAPIGRPTIVDSTGNPAYYYLAGATQSGNGSICFAGGADAEGSYVDPVNGITIGSWSGNFAVMYQDSAPVWSSINGSYSGSAAYLFMGDISGDIFDGTTLNLAALSSPTSVSGGASFTQNGGAWSELTGGTATLQLLP